MVMAGPSVCGSSTLCICCRSLLEKHGLLHQLCNCADLSSAEQKDGPCAPSLIQKKQHGTTYVQDKNVPLTGNPYFTSIVTKSQLRRPFVLGVPVSFYPYLPDACVPVVLSCQNRNWKMWYAGHFSCRRFFRGWKQFAIDNDLKMGDACVYELMDIENLNFRVQILSGEIPWELAAATDERADSPVMIDGSSKVLLSISSSYFCSCDHNLSKQEVGDGFVYKLKDRVQILRGDIPSNPACAEIDIKCEEQKIATSASNPTPNKESVSSELQDKIVPLTGNPYFTSIVTKSQLEKPFQLWVPRWFSPFLPAASGNVVLTRRGRSWDMWYDGHFRRGWKQFAIDNDLKVGDGCVYELMDREKMEFKVQILDGDIPLELLGAIGRSTGMPMVID